MSVTGFSFFMALLFSFFFILAVHFLRKNSLFLRSFGITTILLLYTVCFARMGFAVEFPFTKAIGLRCIYNKVYGAVAMEGISVAGMQVSWLQVLSLLWIVSSTFVLIGFLWSHYTQIYRVGKFSGNRNISAEKAMERVKREANIDLDVKVFVCPGIAIPFAAGIIRKWIVLPDRSFTEEDLYYILKHEYGHLCNHDLAVLMLIHIYCCIFWWNPMVYLLKTDVADILEIKCDMVVTQKFSKTEKLGYLELLYRIAREAPVKTGKRPRMAARFFTRKEKETPLIERFKLITKPIKKPVWVGQAIVIAVSIGIWLASYCFILQPAFDPPEEDIYTDSSVREIHTLYLIKHKDGTYSEVFEDGWKERVPIGYEDVFLSQGYEIVEE